MSFPPFALPFSLHFHDDHFLLSSPATKLEFEAMEGKVGLLSPATPISASPLSCVSVESGSGDSDGGPFVIETARLLRAIHDMGARYDDCYLSLRRATADLAALRRENLDLTAENLHLSRLVEEREAAAAAKKAAIGFGFEPDPPDRSCVNGERKGGPRGGATPKSISIRSKGFLSPAAADSDGGGQLLRVRGLPAVEQGEGEVEVEVYRQGAEKTELCNKWAAGRCPYGERCRFAHGAQELRPVIRHPLYKTLPCRMFPAGRCPYGHRCHFRHSPLASESSSRVPSGGPSE